MKTILIVILAIFAVACSKQPRPATIRDIVKAERADVDERVPGTVEDVWEEPMQDTIMVPAQLDPTETYYRPAHRTVVEINEGRVQPVQYPNEE